MCLDVIFVLFLLLFVYLLQTLILLYNTLLYSLNTVNNGDVIKVYYVIDEDNTKDLSYTVEYYKEGTKIEEDTQIVSFLICIQNICLLYLLKFCQPLICLTVILAQFL